MELFRAKSESDAKKHAATALKQCFAHAQVAPVLFMASGGSALALLDDMEGFPTMTLTVLDERYTQDPDISNFSQVAKTRIFKTAGRFFDTRPQKNETLKSMAMRFEDFLREWKEKHPAGFVIATQGVGVDGHTAGIMPYPEHPEKFSKLFDDSRHWVREYDAREKSEYSLRMTVTLHFLRELVDETFVYVVGKEKQGALARVLSSRGDVSETPARILQEMKHVRLFTDSA